MRNIWPGFRPAYWMGLLTISVFLAGCTRIHQEERWTYNALETVEEVQTVCVESDPPASLWVDGTYVGETPVEIPFSYGVNEIRLIRRQMETSGFGERETLAAESETCGFLQETAHTLHFRASGFHDRFLPLTVPRFDESVHVKLKQKIGPGFPVTVRLDVTALNEQLPLIRSIIQRYALAGGADGVGEGAATDTGPDSKRQHFTATVAGPDALSDLLDALFAAARERHFVFNVAGADMTARFAANPVREFRAVWVAYLDWPEARAGAGAQKAALIRMFDAFKRLHLNAIFMHIRVEADALYRTDLAPWSRLLTGEQGRDPGYDPLAFAVSTAHERGIELHAWLNPYRTRISTRCGNGAGRADPAHVSRTHPDWVLEFQLNRRGRKRCYRMLNPGIPEVTDHIADVVADVVRRYSVDGIHFDDMFYPYPEGAFAGAGGEDLAAFRRREDASIDLKTWRRDNINRMIRAVNDRIKSIKPFVRFGVSPFGIWQNGVPQGVIGMSGRDAIYSDPLAWLEAGSIDYLTPQLYWKVGGRTDYRKLLDWWAEKGAAFDRHIYPGQIVYYLREGGEASRLDKPESPDEVLAQMDLNRNFRDQGVLGNVFYRTVNIQDRPIGRTDLGDRLQEGRYATPALPPVMPWLSMEKPLPPESLKFSSEEGQGDSIVLTWDDPNPPNSVWKYAVYAIHREDLVDDAPKAAGNLIAVTGRRELNIDADDVLGPGDRVYVTAVSRNNVESGASAGISLGLLDMR